MIGVRCGGFAMLAQTWLAESSLCMLEVKSLYTRTRIVQVYMDMVQLAQFEPG